MGAEDKVFTTDRSALADRLKGILPARCLLVDEEDLRPYECDGLTAYRELPWRFACRKRKSRCAMCCASARN